MKTCLYCYSCACVIILIISSSSSSSSSSRSSSKSSSAGGGGGGSSSNSSSSSNSNTTCHSNAAIKILGDSCSELFSTEATASLWEITFKYEPGYSISYKIECAPGKNTDCLRIRAVW